MCVRWKKVILKTFNKIFCILYRSIISICIYIKEISKTSGKSISENEIWNLSPMKQWELFYYKVSGEFLQQDHRAHTVLARSKM